MSWEVEALAEVLGEIRVAGAREADWWTNDEDHALLIRVLKAECIPWAEGLLASDWLAARVASAAADAVEADRRERDGAICWDTTCLNCASLLDKNYAAYVRADKAEAAVERVRAVLDDPPQQFNGPRPSTSLYHAGAWDLATRLRAALSVPTEAEGTAPAGGAEEAEAAAAACPTLSARSLMTDPGPLCWRSECRTECAYPKAPCMERGTPPVTADPGRSGGEGMGCACCVTPESEWLSAASCGYGGGYEPGSQMEFNPECPVHGTDPANRGTGAGWPCDDYLAPLTCWTVPSGRKVLICQGCRETFPNGAEVQALYAKPSLDPVTARDTIARATLDLRLELSSDWAQLRCAAVHPEDGGTCFRCRRWAEDLVAHYTPLADIPAAILAALASQERGE